ncbi:MAG: Maf family protein, partial [Patescibacteria group bacterium]
SLSLEKAKLVAQNHKNALVIAADTFIVFEGKILGKPRTKTEAKEMFDRAYSLYSLFWAVRLKLVDAEKFKSIAAADKPWTSQDIVAKLVNCCDE